MTKNNLENGSIALGMVFGLGILGLGIAASTLLFATSSVSNNSIAGSGVRSLITADSASREGVYRALDSYDPDAKTVGFASASIPLLNDTDSANVGLTGAWPVYELQSTSTNPRTTRVVVATLDLFPSAFAFDQAVYTNGNLNFNGNVTIDGSVYATDGINLGGSADINGNAYTPDDITTSGSADVNGDSIDNHDSILPPTVDITPYVVEATADGTYYSDGGVAGAILQNANHSGTYYVADDMSISGNNTDFSGVLVVTGDLSITGGDFTTDSANPLVIYVGGNLNISGNVTINGIVLVEGETTFGNGNPVVNGSLISANGANKAGGGGNITINYDSSYSEQWQDIIGLETESGTEPRVVNWHEE
jgi:cytoskeletal protein CcmA (bactofilin family)